MPKLSICIPAYNQADHLKKTIDSILCQTFNDYEIVITDDSPGNIVSEMVGNYNLPDRIRYFKNATILGSPENWNEAIRRASGEYIKILHHDDWLNFDDSLEKYVRLLDENPGVDFAFSATQAIFPRGDDWVHEITIAQVAALKLNPLILFNNNVIGAPSTTIIRNNPALRFDPKLKWHVDIEYYIRQITANPNVAYSQELLVVTFLADGRVTDECLGNKEVEIYEYFYLLDKISANKSSYDPGAFKNCILKTITICKNYSIRSVQDITACKYFGKIHYSIRIWLALNMLSTALGRLYLKILRKLKTAPLQIFLAK